MEIKLSPNDDFDKALLLNREPNTVFILTGGQYYTKGNWYFPDYNTLGRKCVLRGENSTLSLHPDAVRTVNGVARPSRDLNVFWAQDAEVYDLTIDGNESAFRQDNWYVTCGLRIKNDCKVSNIRVRRTRGSYDAPNSLVKQVESFAFSAYGESGCADVSDIIIEDTPENSYISSVLIGYTKNNKLSKVRNVKIDIGKNNWFAFGVNENVNISNSIVRNGPTIGIYNDTKVSDNVTVSNVGFHSINKLLSYIIPPGSTDKKGLIVIKDSIVNFAPTKDIHLVELWNQGSAMTQLGPVHISRCAITKDAASNLYVAVVGNDVRPIVISESIVPSNILTVSNNTPLAIFP